MSLPFYLVNAFTIPTSHHSGNQAAVVLLPASHPKDAEDEWKRLIARDFNFAETAFVVERDDGKWGLRWWTPAVEVALCGHATLAAATTLFTLHPSETSLTFVTRWSGELIATRQPSAPAVEGQRPSLDIAISLPSLKPEDLARIEDSTSSATSVKVGELIRAAMLQLESKDVRNAFTFSWSGELSAIIEIGEDVPLADLKVDIKRMLDISKGIIVVTQIIPAESSAGRLVIKSRVFGPGVGVDEDPVTGAAHAFLTAYYTSPPIFRRLPSAVVEGRSPTEIVLDATQLSQRQGRLECRFDEEGRANLTGKGAIWGQGQLPI